MSMALHVGGHLSHGSKVAYSGKTFNVVHYSVDDKTERLDYDAIRDLALKSRPKMIIAGYTSYPWAPDWQTFRAIADEVGAYLLADIAHVAGLTAAGAFPSPVGIADAVMFTTHKTFNGPRGAVIITHKATLGEQIDRRLPGVPGRTAYGGRCRDRGGGKDGGNRSLPGAPTPDSHQCCRTGEGSGGEGRSCAVWRWIPLVLIDCKTVKGAYGTSLMGDPAALILDIAGIVANRNTIPGDTTALYPSGIRLGTPWVTQRGLNEADMEEIADVIASLFRGTTPYVVEKRRPKYDYRARVDFDVLEEAKVRIAALAAKAADPYDVALETGYPHFYFINDKPKERVPTSGCRWKAGWSSPL